MVERRAHDLAVLVISEDRDAHETIQRLLAASFGLLVDGCQTQRIRFDPQNTLGKGEMASRANRWKSRKGESRQSLIALRRAIATRLLEGAPRPEGFVAFHFDGDRRWADRDTSENADLFESQIITPVRALITHTLAQRGEDTAEHIDAVMSRLLRLVPFYSIEAWLLQNTTVLRRILRDRYADRDLSLVESWEADRELLDEIWQPKEAICVRALHNAELARAWPAETVWGVGKSYAATVEEMMECAALGTALEATWGAWSS